MKIKYYILDTGESKSRTELISDIEIDQIRNWNNYKRSYKCKKNKYLFKSKRLAKECYDYCIANCSYFCTILSGSKFKHELGKITFDEWYNMVCWHPFEDKFRSYLK